jgi:hypothetical protein
MEQQQLEVGPAPEPVDEFTLWQLGLLRAKMAIQLVSGRTKLQRFTVNVPSAEGLTAGHPPVCDIWQPFHT